jgi:hypothetical protein
MMTTMEKSVHVGADRRVSLDFEAPESWTGGDVLITFLPSESVTVSSSSSQSTRDDDDIPLLRLWGSCAGKDTLDAYFKRHKAEKERELAQEKREREARV